MNRRETQSNSSNAVAFSMVETVFSIVLVAGMFVAAMQTTGAMKMGQLRVANQLMAQKLAESLLWEIIDQNYEDPDAGNLGEGAFDFSNSTEQGSPLPLGTETGESTADRSDFDDVDDYHLWKAGPPEERNGTVIPNLTDWERSVTVSRAQRTNLRLITTAGTGLKLITVSVAYKGALVAELQGIKALELPEPSDEAKLLFISGGFTAVSPEGDEVVLPTARESQRISLMEAWGFKVEPISALAAQDAMDAAASRSHVVFVSGDIEPLFLSTRLKNATIGIVIEEELNWTDFEICANTANYDAQDVDIDDADHFISSPFPLAPLRIMATPQTLTAPGGTRADSLHSLARIHQTSDRVILCLETGGKLLDGSPAAGRRVVSPWGDPSLDFSMLNADAKTLYKRMIYWAAGMESELPTCGDGKCTDGESSCNCTADCGTPSSTETNCSDMLDNDCDSKTDCLDIDCISNLDCEGAAAVCGNGVCQPGEDCNSCGADCEGKLNGPAGGRFCCGNGVLETAEGDATRCDGNP